MARGTKEQGMSDSKATLNLFISLFERIKLKMQWSDEKIFFWWNTKNPNIGGSTPFNFFQKRPAKCKDMILSMLKEGNGNDAQGS
jgi:hypothetical protein